MNENGESITVFDLTDTSIFADSDWLVGQVEVYNRKVMFTAEMGGEGVHGWVGIDNIMVSEGESCDTIPSEAQVSTVPPETTTAQGRENNIKK